jgi:hypothetical protein
LVFTALNRVELVLAVFVAGAIISQWNMARISFRIAGIAALSILLVQTFWLLPALDQRAELLFMGAPLPDSNLHLYFGVGEVLKVTALFVVGLGAMKWLRLRG